MRMTITDHGEAFRRTISANRRLSGRLFFCALHLSRRFGWKRAAEHGTTTATDLNGSVRDD
jgi:hypothetical protein